MLHRSVSSKVGGLVLASARLNRKDAFAAARTGTAIGVLFLVEIGACIYVAALEMHTEEFAFFGHRPNISGLRTECQALVAPRRGIMHFSNGEP